MRKCECGRDVFGTDKNTNIGYCASHQWKRTDKPKRSVLRHSDKKPVHSIDFGFESQWSVFMFKWREVTKGYGYNFCPYTKENLNQFFDTELFVNCFAHVLNKKNYPYFKCNPANIEVVNPEFHRIVDQGTTKDREAHPNWKWDLWDAKVLQMKEAYIQFKKENLLP